MAQQIVVSDDMLGALNATRPWVKFLAILGFVLTALMVLGALAAFTGIYSGFSKAGMPSFVGPVFGILYIVMAVFFYVIPCLYLYRYAKAIASISATGQEAFEDALKQQKSFWKYVGIFTIIVIAVYVLCIVGGIAFAIIYGASHHP